MWLFCSAALCARKHNLDRLNFDLDPDGGKTSPPSGGKRRRRGVLVGR